MRRRSRWFRHDNQRFAGVFNDQPHPAHHPALWPGYTTPQRYSKHLSHYQPCHLQGHQVPRRLSPSINSWYVICSAETRHCALCQTINLTADEAVLSRWLVRPLPNGFVSKEMFFAETVNHPVHRGQLAFAAFFDTSWRTCCRLLHTVHPRYFSMATRSTCLKCPTNHHAGCVHRSKYWLFSACCLGFFRA